MADAKRFVTRDAIDQGVDRFSRPHIVADTRFRNALNFRFTQQQRLQVPRKILATTGASLPAVPTAPYAMYCGAYPAAADVPTVGFTRRTGAIHGFGGTNGVGDDGVIAGDGSEQNGWHNNFGFASPGAEYLGCTWTASPTLLEPIAAGETLTSEIICWMGCSWDAVNRNGDDWFSFTPTTSLSRNTISVVISANADASRTGYIDITNRIAATIDDVYYPVGSVMATVTITQEGVVEAPACGLGGPYAPPYYCDDVLTSVYDVLTGGAMAPVAGTGTSRNNFLNYGVPCTWPIQPNVVGTGQSNFNGADCYNGATYIQNDAYFDGPTLKYRWRFRFFGFTRAQHAYYYKYTGLTPVGVYSTAGALYAAYVSPATITIY